MNKVHVIFIPPALASTAHPLFFAAADITIKPWYTDLEFIKKTLLSCAAQNIS